VGAADPAIAPDSAPFLLLLLLRRAEAACGDGGEGAGVRGGVWCDAPVSFVGGGQGVPYEFGAWRGVKMQLHFHSFRPILPRSPSLWCPRGSHLPPSRAASTASARPYALTASPQGFTSQRQAAQPARTRLISLAPSATPHMGLSSTKRDHRLRAIAP